MYLTSSMELVKRGIFSGGDNSVCPGLDMSGPDIIPIIGNLEFSQFIVYLGGGFAAVTTIIALGIILSHANRFSNPSEQKQIIRICSLLIFFSLISFLSVLVEADAQYLTPLQDLFEAYVFVSFFLLLCAFISNDAEGIENYFGKKAGYDSHGHQAWFGRLWYSVFQLPVVMTIITIVNESTLATNVFCSTSLSPKFAHLWVTIIKVLSTSVAIVSVIGFYRRIKPDIIQHRPMAKFFAFKGIIAIYFLQSTIFSILMGRQAIQPTEYLSELDLAYGLPALLLCIEMFLFSLFFLYAYPSAPYSIRNGNSADNAKHPHGPQSYHGGPLGIFGLLSAMNILDIFRGILMGPDSLTEGQHVQHQQNAYMNQAPAQVYVQRPSPNYNRPTPGYAAQPGY